MDINILGLNTTDIAWIFFGTMVAGMFASLILGVVGQTTTQVKTPGKWVFEGILRLIVVTYFLFVMLEIT